MSHKEKKRIAVLAGDGIGPEVIAQAVKALKAIEKTFGHAFIFKEALVGAAAIEATGEPLPKATLDLCMKSDAVLFGSIGHPQYDNDPNALIRPEQGLLKLRKTLGVFSNIRPVKVFNSLLKISPVKSDYIKGADFIIYRELTGGIYFGEKNRTETTATDACTYSVEEIERIGHQAFKAAQLRKKKVTLIDKANILETSRLWRDTIQKIAPQYKDVKLDFLFIDHAAIELILNPKRFDVILTENMFGDIISNEASILVGSLGLLPSASIGTSSAMFQPVHGTFTKATGQDIANPYAAILSAALLLDYFEMYEEGEIIKKAVYTLLESGIVTKDLNSQKYYSTSTIGDMVADYISEKGKITMHTANVDLGKSTII
jgi:3-isopropylmalate dehydrogenase